MKNMIMCDMCYLLIRRVTSDLKCSSESNDEVESTDLLNDTFRNDV